MSAMADNRQTGTLVVGLGQTGFSVVRHLAARGESVAVVDSRARPPLLERLQSELPQVQWLGDVPEHLPATCERLVLSPGVPRDIPLIRQAQAAGAEILGDVELFARLAEAPIVGVTGSNGKSTVVSLLGELLGGETAAVRVGGNLGRPALDLLDASARLYVLELSSFQLESTTSLDARVGVVLNLSADHLDRHGDMQSYAAAKARLVRQCRVAVLNRDDPAVAAMADQAREVVWFGAGEPGAGEFGLRRQAGSDWFALGETLLAPVDRLAIRGRHNQLNALAGLAAVHALGESLEVAVQNLGRFRGLPHRMARLGSLDGVEWINDSKATNLGATLAALSGLDVPVVLIAGGQPKGQDFTPLGEALASSARAVVLMGEASESLAAVLPPTLDRARAADMQEAVAQARALARPGDAVLLSPACASFDQFSGFEARGRAFEQAARALGVNGSAVAGEPSP